MSHLDGDRQQRHNHLGTANCWNGNKSYLLAAGDYRFRIEASNGVFRRLTLNRDCADATVTCQDPADWLRALDRYTDLFRVCRRSVAGRVHTDRVK